mgnify:CR=1 FL=1
MKKRKSSKKTSFLSPKNKWSRRGKNLAYFTVSFTLYFFAYIFWWVAFFVKWLFLLFSKRKRPSAKETNSAHVTDKKTRRSDAQADVGLLDRFTRLEVLMAQLENRPIQEGLNIGSIIDLTDGCSKADLVKIVGIATQKAFSRKKGKDISPIVEDDLIGALESVKPSVS